MADPVPFKVILELLESQGWQFTRIGAPYRIFAKPGELPILIPVHDKMVEAIYVQKVTDIIKAKDQDGS